MFRKMLATAVLAGGIALLAPSAAFADSAYYSGLIPPGQRQCVTAAGSQASANGNSTLFAVDYTVLFRPDGTTGFNQIDMARSASFNRSYSRNRTGTFRFCALDPYALNNVDVTLSLTTS